MRDTISIQRANLLHPAIRNEVMAIIDRIEANFPPNVKVRIVQGLRTIEEQNALYAQGRTKPGHRVTNAKGGSSYHNYGLAIDFAIMYNDKELSWDINYDFDKDGLKDWQEVVKPFVAAGYEWGGSWKTLRDNPHLQKTFSYNWRDLLAKHNAKDFIENTQYVKL